MIKLNQLIIKLKSRLQLDIHSVMVLINNSNNNHNNNNILNKTNHNNILFLRIKRRLFLKASSKTKTKFPSQVLLSQKTNIKIYIRKKTKMQLILHALASSHYTLINKLINVRVAIKSKHLKKILRMMKKMRKGKRKTMK